MLQTQDATDGTREPGSWTLALLPDLQNYSDAGDSPQQDGSAYPRLRAMMQWLLDERVARNIRLVVNTGDFTNHDRDDQWARVRRSYELLDGKLPYIPVTGNHDYLGAGGERRTRFNDFFRETTNLLSGLTSGVILGGTFEPGRLENAWYRVSGANQQLLVLALEWAPRHSVLAWANGVLNHHPAASAIVVTHAYLYSDSTRYDWRLKGRAQEWNPHAYYTGCDGEDGRNDGEEIWQKLVRGHQNIDLVISGHVLNEQVGYLASIGDHGNIVHQMLYNRQLQDDGELRLLEFLPSGTVQVRTYSPVTDTWATDPANQFTMHLTSASRAAMASR